MKTAYLTFLNGWCFPLLNLLSAQASPIEFLTVLQARFLENSRAFQTDCSRVRREVRTGKMRIFRKVWFPKNSFIFDAFWKIMSQVAPWNLLLAIHTPTATGVIWTLHLGVHALLWLPITLNFTYIISFNQQNTNVVIWMPFLLTLSIPRYSD